MLFFDSFFLKKRIYIVIYNYIHIHIQLRMLKNANKSQQLVAIATNAITY